MTDEDFTFWLGLDARSAWLEHLEREAEKLRKREEAVDE